MPLNTSAWSRCLQFMRERSSREQVSARKQLAIASKEAAQWHPTSLGTTIERDPHKNPHETFS